MTAGCHDALDSLRATFFKIIGARINRGVGVVTGGGHDAL
jgi:hypothetical protein